MSKRLHLSAWARSLERQFKSLTRLAKAVGARARVTSVGTPAVARALKPVTARRKPPPEVGTWLPGVTVGALGARRYRLYRPPGVQPGERLPLMVMLHGCSQDASGFAAATRMNRIAQRERFLVLYPEQDRLANGQGCWNWYETDTGRAYSEAASIMKAIDQVCLLHRADAARVAVAGLSAGASMAALLVERQPERFQALVMHSGIPPGTAHSGLSALGAMQGRRATRPLAATAAAMAAAWPPLLVIHGDADPVVSPSNGRAAAQLWAQAAGAQAGAERTVRRGQRYPMTVTDFKRGTCTVATLVTVNGLAHAWSGGAPRLAFSDPRGPDASRMTWAFVARQFRNLAGTHRTAALRAAPAGSPAAWPETA